MPRFRLVPTLAALALPTILALVALPVSAEPPELVAPTGPRTPAEELKALHLPDSFVAELVASEPEIHKPLNIAFDDQGRLWLTETLEYPFPAPKGRTPRDSVKVLSDFGPDGRARKVTTFADGLNIPIGILPFPSGREALVHSIPEVLKLTDTDGDGRADRREPLYRSYGFRDTHGMTNAFTWGFDGWVYACHGFSNESRVAGSDKKPIVMQSGNVYRMRPDGTHAEYYSHGQVNPFGLAFDALGNLYSSDCHSRPIYQLLRGAYYPSFGKPDDGIGFGPEMCFHDHGSTGIAGIVYYEADHFPKAYQGTVFVGNVVTARINHDKIEWHGSTPKAVEQPDFLKSDDPWFRPVDLELGPDGALYVADFYNKIIGHYEVPLTHPGRDRERGRIWRIVYRGTEKSSPANAPHEDFSKASSADLINDLGHPNLTVRMKAANQLAARPDDPQRDAYVWGATGNENPERRVQAMWILQRLGKSRLEPMLRSALKDHDRQVRVHGLRIAGESAEFAEPVAVVTRQALTDPDPFVRRAAADVLGRHPAFENIGPLLALRRSTVDDDTHLIHVTRMALRDQLLGDDAWTRVWSETWTEREESDLADVAPGVPSTASARFLLGYVTKRHVPGDRLVRYVHHAARYGDAAVDAGLLGFLESRERLERIAEKTGAPRRELLDLIKAVQQGVQERGGSLPVGTRKLALDWTRHLLDSRNATTIGWGIELVTTYRFTEIAPRLAALVKSGQGEDEAMAALALVDPECAPAVLGSVLFDPTSQVSRRERAAVILGQSGKPAANAALLAALPLAPERVQSAIAAGLVVRRDGAEALFDVIRAGKASARLLQEPRVAALLGNAGVPDLAKKLDGLLHGLPPADQRINEIIARRRRDFRLDRVPAEADAGAKVFETHCAACHQIAGKGSKVGPQLDGIGGRGPDRLVEDILDPSRNVDQTFRVTTLALKDGRVMSGLLLREEGAVLVLADAQGKEVRVPADGVEERTIAPLSPMPANFAELIPEGDFQKLMAFLIQKAGPGSKQ